MNFPKISFLPLICTTSAALCLSATAVPSLQLDISGGSYDTSSEDVVTTARTFTLYALADLYKNNGNPNFATNQTFYISIAFPGVAESAPDPDFGSFTVASGGSSLTLSALDFGQPANLGSSHGIFPAYYYEFAFTTFPEVSGSYNVEDNPGGPPTGTGLNYRAFDFDMTGLASGVSAHFDLYTDGQPFAPYSHDASASYAPPPIQTRVPDGGTTVALLGFAILGLGGTRRLLGAQR